MGSTTEQANEAEVAAGEKITYVPLPPGTRLRGRHYGLKVAIAGFLGTVVVLFLVAFLLFKSGWLESEPEAVTTEDLFMEDPTAIVDAGDSGSGSGLPGEESGTGATTEGGANGQTSASGTSGGASQGSGTQGGTRSMIPKEGIYEYSNTGYLETVIFGTRDRTQLPATVPAIVTRSGNCWLWDIRFFREYTRATTFCDQGGVLVSTRSKVHNATQAVALDSDSTCVTPTPKGGPALTGSSWPMDCSAPTELVGLGVKGGTQKGVGTVRLLGIETVQVGGTPVQAWHTREETRQSGVGDGTSVVDHWASTTDGMILKYTTDYQARNAWGSVAVKEDLTLRSLSPR